MLFLFIYSMMCIHVDTDYEISVLKSILNRNNYVDFLMSSFIFELLYSLSYTFHDDSN